MMRQLLALTLIIFSALGCSQQYRTADAGISQDEMFGLLDQIEGAMAPQGLGGGSSAAAAFSALKSDQHTAIYFSQYSERLGYDPTFGPVASVASFVDYNFLVGSSFSEPDAFDHVLVFFLSGFVEGVRTYVLVVNYGFRGEQEATHTKIFVSADEGSWSNNEFSVAMLDESGNPSIALRSYDLDNHTEDFASVIQLRVAVLTEGDEADIGKFSTLVGFGGQ